MPRFAICLLLCLGCSLSLHAQILAGSSLEPEFQQLKIDDEGTEAQVIAILRDRTGYMWFGTEDGLYRYDGYEFAAFRHDPSDSLSIAGNSVQSLFEDKDGVSWCGRTRGLSRFDPLKQCFDTVLNESSGEVGGNLQLAMSPPWKTGWVYTISLSLFAIIFWVLHRYELQKEREKVFLAQAQLKSELQIEAALEKVRAIAMEMHNSEVLNEVITTVFRQLQSLGLDALHYEIILFDPDNLDCEVWISNQAQHVLPRSFPIPNDKTAFYRFLLDSWKNQTDYFPYVLRGRAKSDYEKWLLLQTDSQSTTEGTRCSTQGVETLHLYGSSMRQGLLQFTRQNPLPEENFKIVKRFAKLFDQVYTRFLDLKKMEAQTREAQIQEALERVRVVSLTMHESQELQKVIATIFDQLKSLGISMDVSLIEIFDHTNDTNMWVANPQHEYAQLVRIPYFQNPLLDRMLEARKRKEIFFADRHSREVKNHFYHNAFKISELKAIPPEIKKQILERKGFARSVALSEHAAVVMFNWDDRPYSQEENRILLRFSRAFEQAYTRFLDLKKAEASAYEAQVETAMERVRSASMAMHQSDELVSVVHTVLDQLKVLGIEAYRSWIDIFYEEQEYVITWSTDFEGNFQDEPTTYHLDFNETMPEFYRRDNSSSRFIELQAHGSEVKDWFKYLFEMSSDPIFKNYNVPNDLYQIWAKHKYGNVAITKLTPLTEVEKDILSRFAKVFEQAYTRFLDLQKAEAQARESAEAKAKAQITEKELEKYQLRNRISADLHDEIGSNLSSISLLSAMAARRDDIKSDVKEMLSDVNQAARHSSEAIRDIVWFINPASDKLSDLISRMRTNVRTLLPDAEVQFEINGDDMVDRLNPELKRNVYMIGKELLNNISKHARAKKVNVRLDVSDHSLTMEITDDGVGFEPDETASGHGLNNMAARAEQLNGEFKIISAVGKGTKSTLHVKIT